MTQPKYTIAHIEEFIKKRITDKIWEGNIFDNQLLSARKLTNQDLKNCTFHTFVFKDKAGNIHYFGDNSVVQVTLQYVLVACSYGNVTHWITLN